MSVNIAMGGIYSHNPCETSLGFSAWEANCMKTAYHQPRLHIQTFIEVQYNTIGSLELPGAVNIAMGGIYSHNPCEISLGFSPLGRCIHSFKLLLKRPCLMHMIHLYWFGDGTHVIRVRRPEWSCEPQSMTGCEANCVIDSCPMTSGCNRFLDPCLMALAIPIS